MGCENGKRSNGTKRNIKRVRYQKIDTILRRYRKLKGKNVSQMLEAPKKVYSNPLPFPEGLTYRIWFAGHAQREALKKAPLSRD